MLTKFIKFSVACVALVAATTTFACAKYHTEIHSGTTSACVSNDNISSIDHNISAPMQKSPGKYTTIGDGKVQCTSYCQDQKMQFKNIAVAKGQSFAIGTKTINWTCTCKGANT